MNIKKILLFFIILIASLIFAPNVCKADSTSVSNEQTLNDAIEKVNNNEINSITLTESIVVTGPLKEISKDVTIEGKGFTISGNDSWYNTGGKGNQSIITSTAGTLTLKNLILRHGPKQGAQAYGNGKLVLDGVTISECKFSGLIANGGIIEIRDLNLNTDIGIEVGKSTSNPVNTNPKVVMNGTLKTTSQALLYEDDKTKAQLTIDNKEDSPNKLYITSDATFITAADNSIIYETKSYGDIEIENDEMLVENFVTLTINYNENTKKMIITKNETLSEQNLSEIKNVDGKVFVNFVGENNEIFNEDTPITEDLTLTAVYKDVEEPSEDNQPEKQPITTTPKDETPKTGDSNYLEFAVVALSITTLLAVALRRKFV